MTAKLYNLTCLKFYLCLVVILGLASPTLHSEDLTLLDGRVYNDVKVTRVTDDGIEITHSAGAKIIKFSDLAPEAVKKYQEIGRKLEATRRKQAEAEAEAAKSAASAPKPEAPRRAIYTIAQRDEAIAQAKKEGKVIAVLAGEDEFMQSTDKNGDDSHAAFQHYGSLLQNTTIIIYTPYATYDWHAIGSVNRYVHDNFKSVMLPIIVFCSPDLSECYGHVPYIKKPNERERAILKMLRSSNTHVSAPPPKTAENAK